MTLNILIICVFPVSIRHMDFQLFQFLALPFAWTNEAVNKNIIEYPANYSSFKEGNWLGEVAPQDW